MWIKKTSDYVTRFIRACNDQSTDLVTFDKQIKNNYFFILSYIVNRDKLHIFEKRNKERERERRKGEKESKIWRKIYFERGSVPSFVMLHVNFTLPSGQVQLVDVCDNLVVICLDGVAKRHG